MSKLDKDSLKALLVQAKPTLLPLAVLMLLLGVWLAWSSVDQMRDNSQHSALEASRNMGVQLVGQSLNKQQRRLTSAIGSADVQTALGAGDLALASKLIGADWPNVERTEVLPINLDSAYRDLEKGGYGRVALLEAALSSGKPVNGVVKMGGSPHLGLAAPALYQDRLVGVVYAQLPLVEMTSGLQSLSIDEDAYLAMRQGAVTLWERGEQSYADRAESRSAQIADSDLRMVAASGSESSEALGLGAVPALIASLICFGLAYAFWRLSRLRLGTYVGPLDLSPTLEQLAVEPPPEDPEAPKALEIREVVKPSPVLIDRSIFRAYDIRGVVGRTLDPGVAELIGHAVGSLMQEQGLRDIVIGRDGRLSGPELVEGLGNGLRKAGVNVIDIGMVPTPVVYFGAFHLRTGCCISVTGSHNPPDYNGFKIVVGGETLSGAAIMDLHARVAENRLHQAGTPGTRSERDISGDYVQRIASDVQLGRRLRVVVDAGNGVAGEIGPRVLEAIGAEVEELYCEIDGTFPNHHPDPSEPHNLNDLISMVQRLDADLGIAFDGDGDRLGVVTRDGENIFADRLLMLFAADVLERNPGAVILYDVKCTGRLAPHILRHGGSPLMWKTGHSLIKAKMRETGAELAGEMSGHFFFAERWYGFDDGIYAAARLLEILATAAELPDEVLGALPKGVSTPEIKVDAPGGDPHAFVDRFCDGAQFEGARLSTIDGLRVDWPDGWGLVRASNTTPVIVLRFEADTAEALQRNQAAFRERMLHIRPELSLPF